MEQTLTLRPGWNAVFLQVQPQEPAMEAVFAGLPVRSVWSWYPRGTVQFIRDPGEEQFREDGWLAWFPASRGLDSFLSELKAVAVNRCYLVELGGTSAVTLTLRGRPAPLRPRWLPNSFNLVGFPVDREAPPTFGAFFAAEAALATSEIYRLDPAGVWKPVTNRNATAMAPGEAFWIYTTGATTFAGALEVTPEFGESLEFGETLPERRLRIANRSGRACTVRLSQEGGSLPLRRGRLRDDGYYVWVPLQDHDRLDLGPGEEGVVRLSLGRGPLEGGRAESLLVVGDGAGGRVAVDVAAGPLAALGGAVSPRRAAVQAASPFAGLWVGSVHVNKVSQSQIANVIEFTEPQDAGPPGTGFTFRLILHVDATGRVRLLKEVIQMWEEGTPPSSGRYVLVTDDAKIPDFTCPNLVGGEPFCHRITSVAYDFAERELDLSGSFATTGSLAGSINLPPNHPTNPFRHAYHPDHNNKDELGYPITNEAIMESFRVKRNLELRFAATDPSGLSDPAWGVTLMGGTYKEDFEGLHKNKIYVSGTFTLSRATDVALLNQ
jgi:hypothetical protein